MDELIIPEEVMAKATAIAIQMLIAKYESLDMRASGKWADELEVVREPNKAIIRGMDYTQYLTHGRPPSDRLPPVDKIYQWMLDKQSFSGEKTLSRAWAIAKKIQKEGTSWYPNGSDLLEVLEDPKTIEEFSKVIGDYLIVYISEDLIRHAKQLPI